MPETEAATPTPESESACERVHPREEPKPVPKPAKKKTAAKKNGAAKAGGIGSRLIPEKANDDEKKILEVLARAKEGITISAIAEKCWSGKKTHGDAEKGKSISAYRRVVNGLRRLRVRGLAKFVEKTEKPEGAKKGLDLGRTYHLYALTAAGEKFVENLP